MAEHPELHGVIRLEDQGSEALRQVAAEIHKVASQAAHAGHEINHMHHESVLSELKEHVAQVGESFAGLHENVLKVHEGIADLLPAFAALGAVASVGELFELVASQAEKLELLDHTAQIIGTNVHELQALHYAAQRTGTSLEAMDKGLERLNKNLSAAAHGHNKAVAAALQHAHIKLFDDHGHIRTATEILPDFEAALRRTGNEAVRAENAMLFMGRAGQELLPMLTMSAEKQREINEEFEHFHPALSPEFHEALEKYSESLKHVQLAADGFKESIAASMAPILQPLQDELAEFFANQSRLAQNHKGIGGLLETEGKKVKEYLDGVDWNKVQGDIEGLAHATNDVVEAFGGWKIAAEVVAGLMVAKAGMFALSPVFALAGALSKTTKLVWALATAWRGVEGAAGAAEAAEGGAAALAGPLSRINPLNRAGFDAAAANAAGFAKPVDRAAAAVSMEQYVGLRTGWRALPMAVGLAGMAYDAQQGFDVTKDDIWKGFGPHAGSKDLSWGAFNNLPHHGALNAIIANHFGEDFEEHGPSAYLPDLSKLFSGPIPAFKPEDYYSPIGRDGTNPFANPVFDKPVQPYSTTDDRPPAKAELNGDITIKLDIPNAPPATQATMSTGDSFPSGVRVNLGDYGNKH